MSSGAAAEPGSRAVDAGPSAQRRTAEAPTSAAALPGSRRGLAIPIVSLVVVALLVALDLWSKAAVFEWLGDPGRPAAGVELSSDCHAGHYRYVIVPSWLAFMTSYNPGAAFGGLQNAPTLLVVGRCIAVVVLFVLILRGAAHRRPTRVALVLILSGALGNLYDNLFLGPYGDSRFGAVRDFIDVYFGVWDWHFPTFNVADSCITVGAVLLLLAGFRREDEADEAADDGAAQAAA